jgi:5S rRNA maturation endonuclease (ribonuclease M5)
MINTKKCLICKDGKKNNCLHWHVDPEDGSIWVWCQGKCQRGYSIRDYCWHAGIDLPEFLKGDFDFKEAPPNEVQAMNWPARFIPLSDPRAEAGVAYVRSRGLTLEGDMYYDLERKGIVFPYYFDNTFCGAQTRFIEPRVHPDGEIQKMDTLPGTRLGLLFYGWNQSRFVGDVKGVIVTEGSFNAIAINQAFNLASGGVARNAWRAISCSGAGATKHHQEALKELKEQGLKVIIAPDLDDAGMKMLKKFKESDSCTHYALTSDTRDWNDMCRDLGHAEFAKWFWTTVKSIHD